MPGSAGPVSAAGPPSAWPAPLRKTRDVLYTLRHLFDPESSGRPTTWDSFRIWDNRIDEPIMLPPSIRYGKLIPKVSLTKVGCASLIGQRKENEDRFQLSQMTDNIMYFAVFDGHGGAAAAEFCHKNMEKHIK